MFYLWLNVISAIYRQYYAKRALKIEAPNMLIRLKADKNDFEVSFLHFFWNVLYNKGEVCRLRCDRNYIWMAFCILIYIPSNIINVYTGNQHQIFSERSWLLFTGVFLWPFFFYKLQALLTVVSWQRDINFPNLEIAARDYRNKTNICEQMIQKFSKQHMTIRRTIQFYSLLRKAVKIMKEETKIG